MGSEHSKQKKETNKSSKTPPPFQPKELQALQDLFQKLQVNGEIPDESRLKKFLDFSDEMSSSFFKWLQWLAKESSNSKVSMEVFTPGIEFITKQKSEYLFRGFSKHRLTAIEQLVAITYFPSTWSTANFETEQLTKQQCEQILTYVLSIFGVTKSNSSVSAVIQFIFKMQETETISVDKFIMRVQIGLQYVSRYILEFWNGRIFSNLPSLPLPTLSDASEILTPEYLPIVYLNNSSVQQAKGLYLLYSSSKSGISFNRLAHAIVGFNAPTLLLIKHKEINKETNVSSNHILGAFHNEQWYSQLKYQGDSQSYIFSLSPNYQTYYAYDGQGCQNYAYLNSRHLERSKFQVGLGFGGNDDFNNFRLWVDDDIQTKSYVRSDDKTYGKGGLVNQSSTNKLDVRCLEIWGIGSEENLQAQLEYRENERKEIEKMRKVDKKALWDNGFNQQMMFGKLAAHRDQVRGDIERPQDDDNKDNKS